MFDNSFVNQYKFDYSKPSDNKDDEMLDPNVKVNVDDKIIPYVSKFRDVSGYSFVVSHNQALNHKCMLRGFDLEIEQTFRSMTVNSIPVGILFF